MRATTPPGQAVVQLRISLRDVHPVVWRRLLVPGSVRLAKLHLMFQAAMGWTHSHLHSFRVGDALYGMRFDDYPPDEIDEKSVTVIGALKGQRSFVYEYDRITNNGSSVSAPARKTWIEPKSTSASSPNR